MKLSQRFLSNTLAEAGTLPSRGTSHSEAIRQLIMSTFPTATISFITTGSNGAHSANVTDTTASVTNAGTCAEEDEKLMEQLRMKDQESKQSVGCSESLGARRGPFTDCCSPQGIAEWQRLHQLFPAEAFVNAPQPCWTPHAVVYIGGFEAPDLRRTVAPRLFEKVPAFVTDSEREQTVGGRTAAGGRQKNPKYATKTLHTGLLMSEKGCALHEPDLLQLALPHVGPSAMIRTRTYLSFAGAEPNVTALNGAVDPMQRVALRPAFGYSAAALRNTLPFVVVGASLLLRRWNARWSSTTLSSAFWLSAVGHAVESGRMSEAGLLVQKGGVDANSVMRVLAMEASSIAKNCPEDCCVNYFLPSETFELERGFAELMNVGPRLPIDDLKVLPVYPLLVRQTR
ncbi:hypothetical protein DPX39_110019400 [Trypanosoma brucei equiperdum]|uniref:Uncharacterized protein n=1 Tax=Trypanosoma brucei equiperdum TaxID=630700 RepID=A0A3L6KWA1_9TRYP|nr:hypothetical protein DPX39_110019400 [Trypanosoma brucei equiperdum]